MADKLTPEQKRLYKEMKNLSFTMLDDEIMSVQVALTKLLRLHQILCGSFTTDDGQIQKIPNNRIEALSEVLDETSGKVIIWANYLQNIEDIKQLLTEKYGAESFVVYTGATGNDDRVEAIKQFQNANSPVRFFLGNVQTAGRGITLTAAQTVIYFSNNYSLEMRQQSEDRAHRVGQVNNVTYVDLVVRDSLDEKIIAIPCGDPTYNDYYDIHELPQHVFQEMMHFFEVYKTLEHKRTTVKEICHRDEAVDIINKCVENYKREFANREKKL